MNQEWTVERVKQELPDVTILIKEGMVVGKFPAVVCGRRNTFATVRVANGLDFQFAWSTIANALNNNRPLRLSAQRLSPRGHRRCQHHQTVSVADMWRDAMKRFNDIMGLARNCASLLTYEQQAALVSHMLEAVNCANNPVPELVNVLDALIIAAKYLDINPTWYEVGDYVKTPERKTDVPKGIESEWTGLVVERTMLIPMTGLPAYQRIVAQDRADERYMIDGAARFFAPEAYQPVHADDLMVGDYVMIEGVECEVTQITPTRIFFSRRRQGQTEPTEHTISRQIILKKMEDIS